MLTAVTIIRCCVVGRHALNLASFPRFIYHLKVVPILIAISLL